MINSETLENDDRFPVHTIYLVSHLGTKPIGGVEWMMFHVYEILRHHFPRCKIVILSADTIKTFWLVRFLKFLFLGRSFSIFYPLLYSLFLTMEKMRKKKLFVISNGFYCPFYEADVVFAHGTFKGFLVSKGYRSSFREKMIDVFEYRSFRSAKKLIAVSKGVLWELENFYGISERRIAVLENPVDVDTFQNQSSALESGDGRRKVIFVGRVEERKGSALLDKIVDEMDSLGELCICTPLGQKIDPKLLNDNRIKFVYDPPRESIVELLNKAHLFILPSVYEGFSLAVLEALACGCPVLGLDENYRYWRCLKEKRQPGVFYSSLETYPKEVARLMQKDFSLEERRMISESAKENYNLEKYKLQFLNLVTSAIFQK
jgi:glycosyltransferase involved in cell wall biosynthesis